VPLASHWPSAALSERALPYRENNDRTVDLIQFFDTLLRVSEIVCIFTLPDVFELCYSGDNA
jgi:hypothetical protein